VSNDHIPDVTKMINATPRTDAAEYESQDEPAAKLGAVDAEFARQLERHLNGANDLIVRLQAITNDPHALWINWLRGSVGLPVGIGDVRQYQDRIKRLEDALTEIELAMKQPASSHRLMQISGPARQVINIINKAKEAKP
jgi:hypothetical protein